MKPQAFTPNYLYPLFLLVMAGIGCDTKSSVPPVQDQAFLKLFGGPNQQQGIAIQQTSEGGFILIGSTSSAQNGENRDIYVVKTDVLGNETWSQVIDFQGRDDIGNSVVLAEDGGYIIGGTVEEENGTTQAVLVKVSSSGEATSPQLFGNPNTNETGSGLALAPDGGVILLGSTTQVDRLKNGGYQPDTDSVDLFVLKVRANLQTIEWEKTYGFQGKDWGTDVIPSPSGQGYVVLGTTDFPEDGASDLDFLLVRLNENGNVIGSRNLGEAGLNESAQRLHPTSDGGFICIGTSGSSEVKLLKVDASLNEMPISGLTISGAGTDVTTTENGDILITGTFTPTGGETDIFLHRLSAEGSVVWPEPTTFGGADKDQGGAVLSLPDGRIALVGTTSFGTNTMMALIKTNGEGDLLP